MSVIKSDVRVVCYCSADDCRFFKYRHQVVCRKIYGTGNIIFDERMNHTRKTEENRKTYYKYIVESFIIASIFNLKLRLLLQITITKICINERCIDRRLFMWLTLPPRYPLT